MGFLMMPLTALYRSAKMDRRKNPFEYIVSSPSRVGSEQKLLFANNSVLFSRPEQKCFN